MKEAMKEMDALIGEAKAKVNEMPSAEQIVGVKTAKGNVYFFANNVLSKGAEDEIDFWKELCDKSDTEIKYVVCMWNNHGIEIPSMSFRKMILESVPKNAETILILQGKNGIVGKTLGACMPA